MILRKWQHNSCRTEFLVSGRMHCTSVRFASINPRSCWRRRTLLIRDISDAFQKTPGWLLKWLPPLRLAVVILCPSICLDEFWWTFLKGRPLSVWPHLFSGACHEKRRGEQLKWSLAFRLYIGSFPCAQLPGPIHTARLGRVCFFVYSLGLCFVCPFMLFDLFVYPHSFTFPWAVESCPLQFLALA